ncbi:hypothetical protein GGR50DRAFT_63440 [Xylaria sp. CBS 124048]|nr:hypothetical protein GGR50DRAFT_63440 [Xylaria sp. CBS 124048]
MQSSTNPNENLELSAKPALGPNRHIQPTTKSATTAVAINTSRAPTLSAVPPVPAHGFIDPGLENQLNIPPHVRAPPAGMTPDMMQRLASTSEELGPVSNSPTATTMAAQGIIGHDPDDSVTDGRKAKRELSQSKRAAQNRAAQRAFRQRKEHYIKKLEQQVREYTEMEHTYKAIQNDNYALREYVIQLQSRLLDLQVEPPLPPPNVNIAPPGAAGPARPPHGGAPGESTSNAATAGTLADVAAAVAGLRAREPGVEGNYPKSTIKGDTAPPSHDNDDIRRQLEADGLPPPSLRA